MFYSKKCVSSSYIYYWIMRGLEFYLLDWVKPIQNLQYNIWITNFEKVLEGEAVTMTITWDLYKCHDIDKFFREKDFIIQLGNEKNNIFEIS